MPTETETLDHPAAAATIDSTPMPRNDLPAPMTQPSRVTRSELAERGADALQPQTTRITGAAGGVAFATALEVIEFAKIMSTAGPAVPAMLRNNPGACLRICFQAVEWRMSPWAVADKSYLVNDRIAYESQLIHAVIESRAPLRKRLECRYDGEGATRSCTVAGTFLDGEVREYTSPEMAKIKVKNSPLWTADPDQQLWYYASRAWARKWAPDVLMGIYSREELAENQNAGREYEEPSSGSGLHERLSGGQRSSDEGHRPGHAASELDQIGAGARGVVIDATPAQAGDAETSGGYPAAVLAVACPECGAQPGQLCQTSGKARAEAHKRREGAAVHAKAEEPVSWPEGQVPKTSAEYTRYARAWITATPDAQERRARWKSEMKLRNDCGVTSEDRAEVEPLLD